MATVENSRREHLMDEIQDMTNMVGLEDLTVHLSLAWHSPCCWSRLKPVLVGAKHPVSDV